MCCPHRSLAAVATLVALLTISGCGGPDVDVSKVLALQDITTGYFDAGIVDGKNKLVPTIAFRLKNVGTEPIDTVNLMGRFNQIGDDMEWGSGPYIRAIGVDGLAPGQVTGTSVMRLDRGYLGEQPRLEMLRNREFLDVQVQIFAKYRAQLPKKLGQFTIARQLLTR